MAIKPESYKLVLMGKPRDERSGSNPCQFLRKRESEFKTEYLDAKSRATQIVLGNLAVSAGSRRYCCRPNQTAAPQNLQKRRNPRSNSETSETNINRTPRRKTRSTRSALNQQARSLLKALKYDNNSRFVFPSDKSESGQIESLDQAWRTIKAHAELYDNFRLHDLRHTYASHTNLSGVSMPVI